jgi:hypothetical protein
MDVNEKQALIRLIVQQNLLTPASNMIYWSRHGVTELINERQFHSDKD